MAWVRFKNKVPMNTSAIEFVNTDRDGRAYISVGSRIIKLHENKDAVERKIMEAERAERRQIFQENKDELLEELTDRVVGRLNEMLNLDKSRVQSPVTLKPKDR